MAAAVLAVGLASCQGNLGSPTGLSIPQTGNFGQPGSQGQGGGESRQRALDGAVYMSSDLSEIPLPSIGGFAVSIHLGTPGPSATPSAVGSASPSASPGAKARHTPAGGLQHARAVAPSAAPSPSPSASPSPEASASPSPSPSASGKASAKASPGAASKPKIVTKTTIYPEDAPAAPTPEPSGDVQTFFKRTPIVRGYLQTATDISLYGLGAVRFTIPDEEEVAGRGFTIAFFEAGKKHHEKLLSYDSHPTLSEDVVSSNYATTPIAMKKGQSYVVVLYGDEEAPTPGPVRSSYPQPGQNPFVTPAPPGYPQQGQGYPQGQPGQPYPYPTQTPFGTYPTQTPHY